MSLPQYLATDTLHHQASLLGLGLVVGGSSELDCVCVCTRVRMCVSVVLQVQVCTCVCVCVCKQQDALNCPHVGWKSAVFSVCNLVQTCHEINENKCLQCFSYNTVLYPTKTFTVEMSYSVYCSAFSLFYYMFR